MDDLNVLNVQRMFEDEDFKHVVARVKLDFFQRWSRERKPDARERLWLQQQALDDLLTRMRAIADEVAMRKKLQ